MDEIKFSIQASVHVNGKELQGNLNIDSRGFAFDSSGRKIFSIKCDWKNAICTRAIEKRSRLLFLKVEKIFYIISFDNFVSDKIFIRSEDEKRFNEIIKNVKEYCIREDELKRQEKLACQEAERKRQEELARQEAERKLQEDLQEKLSPDYLYILNNGCGRSDLPIFCLSIVNFKVFYIYLNHSILHILVQP